MNRDINRFHTPAEYKLIDIYRGWLYFEWIPRCFEGYRLPGVRHGSLDIQGYA